MKSIKYLYFSHILLAMSLLFNSINIVWATDRGPGGLAVDNVTEKRVALVIGNSNYRIGFLPNPHNDAEDMEKMLKQYGFSVIHKQDLNHRDMKTAIRTFKQGISPNGISLFYYAGHGMQIDGHNYLVPLGADIEGAEDVEYNAVDAQWVVKSMNKAGSRVNIVILDACRNNPFRGFFRSQEGLAAMYAPDGTIISYATALGKKAADGNKRNGLYTEKLLAAIQMPGLPLEKVFKQTATEVKRVSGGQQVPWVSTSLTGKDFCFSPCQKQITSVSPETSTSALLSSEIQQLLQICQRHFKAYRLTSGRGGTALACYENVLKKDPTNEAAVTGIEKIETRYITWIKRALERKQTRRAKRYLASLRLVNPESPQLADFEMQLNPVPVPIPVTPNQSIPVEKPSIAKEIDRLLAICKRYYEADRLTVGQGGTALSCYRDVLEKDADNAAAQVGLRKIEERYVILVNNALGSGNRYKAEQYLERIAQVNPNSSYLAELKERLVEPQSGKMFRDRLKNGGLGPEMVWIPAGSFDMGSNEYDDEKPVHRVSIKRFAMGKYEVTVGEYMRFVRSTGRHAPEWQEKGSQYNIKTGTNDYYKELGSALTNKNHPMVGISWNDVVAYTKWLSDQTGKKYRLPSEAEWEYAARGGTATKYWWGNGASHEYMNYSGTGGKDRWKSTSPVGSFKSNAYGLHDTLGNVWEWVQDWYDGDYYSNSPSTDPKGPSTGSYRVYRGGSWSDAARLCRTAGRNDGSPGLRDDNVGFRLSRHP